MKNNLNQLNDQNFLMRPLLAHTFWTVILSDPQESVMLLQPMNHFAVCPDIAHNAIATNCTIWNEIIETWLASTMRNRPCCEIFFLWHSRTHKHGKLQTSVFLWRKWIHCLNIGFSLFCQVCQPKVLNWSSCSISCQSQTSAHCDKENASQHWPQNASLGRSWTLESVVLLQT